MPDGCEEKNMLGHRQCETTTHRRYYSLELKYCEKGRVTCAEDIGGKSESGLFDFSGPGWQDHDAMVRERPATLSYNMNSRSKC